MNVGTKLLGKQFARAIVTKIPLQPFTTLSAHNPHLKRTNPTFNSLTTQLFTQLIKANPLSAATLAATIAAVATASAASASELPHDELPLVGSYGIGKPKRDGSGQRGPQKNLQEHLVEGGKVGQAGEDAFFVAANGRAWGVADGVGGWADVEGADSAAYSRTLMYYALMYADRVLNQTSAPTTASTSSDTAVVTKQSVAPASPASLPSKFLSSLTSSSSRSTPPPSPPPAAPSIPLSILDSAYTDTATHKIIGSTTACIVTYDPTTHKLQYANLGDSGFLLIRHSATSHIRSKETQHSFNCPYQLGSQSRDRPADATRDTLPVYDQDILILATDGFFDNLHAEEIIATTQQHTQQSHNTLLNPAALAERLCKEAYAAASDVRRDTPFSQYCRRFGKRHSGGKMDDISVVVVQFRVPSSTVGQKAETAVDDKLTSKL